MKDYEKLLRSLAITSITKISQRMGRHGHLTWKHLRTKLIHSVLLKIPHALSHELSGDLADIDFIFFAHRKRYFTKGFTLHAVSIIFENDFHQLVSVQGFDFSFETSQFNSNIMIIRALVCIRFY